MVLLACWTCIQPPSLLFIMQFTMPTEEEYYDHHHCHCGPATAIDLHAVGNFHNE